ncbi:MAG: cytochrome b/b6 domain-containing protein [Burkholderiaceae bacterium]
MRSLLDRLNNPLHLLIALACAWLVASSPWIGMYQALPDDPGAINLSHVVIGLAVLPLAFAYFAACTVGGRWRLYFPWVAGQFGDIGRDLAGIGRGERPGSEGGGLFATVEGLLLLALLAAAITGALWFLGRNTESAVMWRGPHIVAARALIALMILHVLAVLLHLVDLVRD